MDRHLHGSPEESAEAMERLMDIFSQDRIRHRGSRQGPRAQDLPPVDPETIPIHFVGPVRSTFFFPATPDDLTEIMRRLPPLSINGLEGVHLVIKGSGSGSGRVFEILPGFIAPNRRGTYALQTRIIRLFPYARIAKSGAGERLDRKSRLMVSRRRKLKIYMLSTFVHEVAHHVDWLMRAGRLSHVDMGTSRAKREAFAERMQDIWTRDLVVPYVGQLDEEHLDFC